MRTASARATALTLLAGVGASGVLLLTGIVLSLVHPHPSENLSMGDLKNLVRDMQQLDAVVLIHLGLLILLVTPFARVIVLAGGFIRSREAVFAAISFGVLLLLTIGVLLGLRWN